MTTNLLKPREVCEYLSIGMDTLYYYVSIRKIPYIKLGRGLRFRLSDIDQWLEESKVKAL